MARVGGCMVVFVLARNPMSMKPIQSTGHHPTDHERALTAIETVLKRIREQVEAALIALGELKLNIRSVR